MRCLVVMLLLVLVGCTQPGSPPPSSPAVSPSSAPVSPTPTPTCSPMGGTPRPCSTEEYQKTEEQNRLTEKAIALYRRWTKESTRLYRVGGTDKPTKEMLATTAGKFRASVLGIFQDLRAARVHAASGEVRIETVGLDSSANVPAGSVGITACLDARSLTFKRDGKTIRRGTLAVEDVVVKNVDGQMRLWSARSGEVASC